MPSAPFVDVFTSSPCTFLTPAGPVLYWVLAPCEGGYGEQFVAGQGCTTTIRVAVRWDDSETFRQYVCGSTSISGAAGSRRLRRQLPLRCEFDSDQWATACSLVKTVGEHSANAFSSWFQIDGAVIYDVEFQTRPYDLLTDDKEQELDGGAGVWTERFRFVEVNDRFNPTERKVPNYTFRTVGTHIPIPEVGFVPEQQWDFVRTWRMVPYQYYPKEAIEACAIHVNDDVFRLYIPPGNASYLSFTAGQLLFAGIAEPIIPYRHVDGTLYVDLRYVIRYRPWGWNYFPLNNGTYTQVEAAAAPNNPPYASADFDTLFKLSQA